MYQKTSWKTFKLFGKSHIKNNFMKKHTWAFDVKFIWYDLWVGFYWDRNSTTLYFCPLPTIVFMLRRFNLLTPDSGLLK